MTIPADIPVDELPAPLAGSVGAAVAAEAAGLPDDVWTADPREALRVGPDFHLDQFVHDATPGFTGGKSEGTDYLEARGPLLGDLQERLFAQSRSGSDERSVLLVVQGMDSAGKGGIARHVMGIVDPQGVALRSFGVPTAEEKRHHFLWRIKQALPAPGKIGLFDRSHYEDVLVGKVDKLAPAATIEKRYGEINRFEKRLVESGTIVLKVALLISPDEQVERQLERIDNPEKRWKYNPGDLDTRAKWDEYRAAYQTMFERTSTAWAPWFAVPADRKWYARMAVAEILTRTLEDMNLTWPTVRWRPEVQRRRLAELSSDAMLREHPELAEALGEEALQARREAAEAEARRLEEVVAQAERVAPLLAEDGDPAEGAEEAVAAQAEKASKAAAEKAKKAKKAQRAKDSSKASKKAEKSPKEEKSSKKSKDSKAKGSKAKNSKDSKKSKASKDSKKSKKSKKS